MTAQVPFMITNKMRADLATLGFTEEQIKQMTPAQAWEHLGGMPAPDDPQALDLAGDLPDDMPPPPPDDWPEDYMATPPAAPAPAPSPAPAFIDTFGACVLRAVMDGRPVNGHLDRLPADLRDVAEALQSEPKSSGRRAGVLAAELGKLAGGAAILAAVNAADPAADLDKLLAELPQEHNRFTLIWAYEALEPQPPVNWIVDKLLSAGSVNMLVGPPKSKKTYALLDMAVHVATGTAWLGMATCQAPVLLVDEESGPLRLKRRLGATMRGNLINTRIPIAAVSLAAFDLRQKEEADELKKLIVMTGARLVVIDALADIMPGGDENAVKDVQPLMLALRKIAYDTDSAIILIHHTNKTGDYRGSTALPGAVDCMIQVSSQAGSPNIDFDLVYSRDGEPFKFAAAAHWIDDQQFWLTESDPKQSTRKLNKPHSYVVRYIAGAGGAATIKDIEAKADICTAGSARQAVYSLTNDGYLKRVDGGAQGAPATYGFTDKTQELLDLLGLEVVKNQEPEEAPDDGEL